MNSFLRIFRGSTGFMHHLESSIINVKLRMYNFDHLTMLKFVTHHLHRYILSIGMTYRLYLQPEHDEEHDQGLHLQ